MSPPHSPAERQKFTLNFLTTFYLVSHHLQQVHLYEPLYLTLSGVTRPLHRYLRPFTAKGAFLPPIPREGPFSTMSPPQSGRLRGGLHRL